MIFQDFEIFRDISRFFEIFQDFEIFQGTRIYEESGRDIYGGPLPDSQTSPLDFSGYFRIFRDISGYFWIFRCFSWNEETRKISKRHLGDLEE